MTPARGRVAAMAAGTGLVALAVSMAWLRSAHPMMRDLVGVNWWSLAVAFAVAELLPVHFEHRRETVSFSLSYVPLVIGLYAVSPIVLITARLAGSAATLAAHRRQPPLKLAVNLTSFWVETIVAVVVFRSLTFGAHAGPHTWPAAFVAALAADTAESVLLMGAISLYQRSWERTLIVSAAVGSISAIVDTCVGVVALTTLSAEPAAFIPLGVVAAMVFASYRAQLSLRQEHHHLEQLYEFTSRTADALQDGRVVATLLEQARELMHANAAWLYVTDDGGQLLQLDVDDSGLTSSVAAGAEASHLNAAAHARGRGVILTATEDPTGRDVAHLGAHQVLAGPLVGSSGPIGTLVVGDRSGQVRGFTSDDLRLFATFANHACISLENGHLVDRLRDKAAESEHQSLHDALTGLPNRTMFARRLEQSLKDNTHVGVLLLDLDRFKEVNDTLGHFNGDLLLQQVGHRMRTGLRQGDVVARLGGDEFAVLLPGVEGEDSAVEVAKGIVALFDLPFGIDDMSVDVGVSIGIALSPQHGPDAGTLLQRADVAMYTAKADQSSVELYNQDRDGYSPQRLALMGELRRAIQMGDITVHYQPQVDLRTGHAFGVEALARWQHPERGFVPAGEFVPIAEHTGLVGPMTRLVLESAIRSWRAWRDDGWRLRVSINVSARSLLEHTLVDDVHDLLARFGMPAEELCIEVTESSIMSDPRRTVRTLQRLRGLGITISVDDFGTGHSSLAYLKRLPVTEVKIDQSFVASLLDDPSDEAIVDSVITLARNLKLSVVAEGIETEAVRRRLVEMGCGGAQGYLFGRPMPRAALTDWLARYHASEAGVPEREAAPAAVVLAPARLG